MNLVIGSDHAGYDLKEQLKRHLADLGHQVTDAGVHNPAPADYPDVALAVARAVVAGGHDRGILVCGTGIGSQIAANKVRGARACVCHDTYSARVSRSHNDANVLCLGARVIGPELAKDVLRVWLDEPFSGEQRHRRRLAKIAAAEGDPHG